MCSAFKFNCKRASDIGLGCFTTILLKLLFFQFVWYRPFTQKVVQPRSILFEYLGQSVRLYRYIRSERLFIRIIRILFTVKIEQWHRTFIAFIVYVFVNIMPNTLARIIVICLKRSLKNTSVIHMLIHNICHFTTKHIC